MTPIPAGRWWDRVPSARTPAVSRGIGSQCKKGVPCRLHVTVELSYYVVPKYVNLPVLQVVVYEEPTYRLVHVHIVR